MPNNAPDIIFFIGAGFSKPAGVPIMNEFMKNFNEIIQKIGGDQYSYYEAVIQLLANAHGQNEKSCEAEPEEILDILNRLTQKTAIDTAVFNEIPAIKNIKIEIKEQVKKTFENLIREQCIIESSQDLTYLLPLRNFIKNKKSLDIFSVNYDDVIEVFSNVYNYELEDGYGQYWEPTRFQRNDIDIRLFKLHGSVLAYKSNKGMFYKTVLDIRDTCKKTIFGEGLEPLIAYPISGKPIHWAPLAFAMSTLRERLAEIDQCIVIGYRMRDSHIMDVLIESIRRNPKLKIILVNPDPFKIKHEVVNDALRKSIIPAAFKIEEVLKENKLPQLSHYIKIISDSPKLDPIKRPVKAAQEYFNALDYEKALDLIRTNEFKQACAGISLRNLDFGNILGGLFYGHIVCKHTGNQAGQQEIFDMIVEFLRRVAQFSIHDSYDITAFLQGGIRGAEWVEANLQGKLSEISKPYATLRITNLKRALLELNRKQDQSLDEQKKLLQKYATVMFKWSSDPVVHYDDGDTNWLFG